MTDLLSGAGLAFGFTPYALPPIGAAALAFALAGLAWRRPHIPGRRIFTVLMLTIGEWALAYAFELAGADLATKLWVERFEYVGIVANPVAAVAFALQYTGRGQWLSPTRLAALAAMPVATLVFVWSDPTHGLVQAAVALEYDHGFPVLVTRHGPWFWIHVAYSYALLALASVIVFESLLRSPRAYRGQIAAMLVGILCPLASNVVYLADLAPDPYLDLTPFAFTVTGLAMFVAFFRLGFLRRFLGLPLVARSILITRLPDAVILVDARGTVVEANGVALEVLGRTEDRLVGQSVAAVFPEWASWVSEPENAPPQHHEVVRGQPAGARSYDLLVAPQYVGKRDLVGWVLVLRDMTERKRIETDLAEALAQAEDAVRVRDTFLSIAAHELKTPITSLQLAAQTLPRALDRGAPLDSPAVRRALQAIDVQSIRLSNLVFQLLDLSRLRLGRLTVNRSTVNLVDLVRLTVEAAQERTSLHQIVLSAPDELVAAIDALRFEQVLTNLLDNAIKYSPAGGRIAVAITRSGADRAVLSVRDWGIGVPSESREHIFDLFFQVQPGSQSSGMGVGLFIARQVVELHRGRIWLELPEDGGACFLIEIPLGPIDESTNHDAANPVTAPVG